MKKQFTLLFFLCCSIIAFAQPSNDNCAGAIIIKDVSKYCSKTKEFNNIGATASTVGAPSCFTGIQNDVWFEFTPTNTNVSIVVKGATGTNPGGTLQFPQVALYNGDCTSQQELQCGISKGTSHIVSITKGGLIVGAKHLIRVQGGGGKTGTFQICIENFNPPKEPTGDCNSASILCDKSPFIVQSLDGFGNKNEVTSAQAQCFGGGTVGNIESSSTWFKWTCEKSGTLTFTISPLQDQDDIDFLLFELPKNIDDCDGKQTVRCMATGTTPGVCAILGPTGLRDGSVDTSEPSGCSNNGSQDNFLSPLQMVAGKSYALMINNYDNSKLGFRMEFGGTGTFQGPSAAFVSNSLNKKLCFGEKITFTDNSKFLGTIGKIVKWSWNFGYGANPQIVEEKLTTKPHDVVYNSPGKRYVVLTVESERGCQVTAIDTFIVDKCCETYNKLNFNTIVKNLQCQDILEGSIDLNVSSNSNPIIYKWDYGATTSSIAGLGSGQYVVTITTPATCDSIIKFNITAPPPINTDTLIKRPTCDGGQDGVITLNPQGGIPPYSFDWGNGYVPINTLGNLPVGKYPVFIKDNGGCQKLINVNLRELEINLDPAIEAYKEPSCFGLSNGSIDLKVTNGVAPFQYDFGTGFQNTNSLSGIPAGTYNVTVKDANRCKGTYIFKIGQPEALKAIMDSVLISCFGATDGAASVKVEGGIPNYSYAWSNLKSEEAITKLGYGTYTVTVTDKNNCMTTANVSLNQPPKIDITVNRIKDVVCFNDKTGEVEFTGSGGRAPFQYSLDGVIFQKDNVFKNLVAGDYSLIVKDTAGCEYTTPVKVGQPTPFVLDAGSDKTIDLGDEAQLNAIVLPAGNKLKSIVWTPDSTLSCKNCLDPTAIPLKTITYTIKGVDITDCNATDKVTVFINREKKLYIPNIFSPLDVNGTNDYFTAYGGKAAKNIQLLRVFDRWGNMVYEGKNLPLNDNAKGWDGTFRGQKVNKDVYTYYCVVDFIDGESLDYRGDVTVH